MRKLNRLPLSPESEAFLDARAQRVSRAADPAAEARSLWELKRNKAFREVRDKLETMSSGLQCCMYCEYNEGTDIDHFWPKASYPEKAFKWVNYLWACGHCNSNYKRTQFPIEEKTGEPLLLDPTVDEPQEHLSLSPSTGKFEFKTAKGEKSIDVFGLNRQTLEKRRGAAWRNIKRMLLDYDRYCERQEWRLALQVQEDLCRAPFASVFVCFLAIASGPHASRFIEADSLRVLGKYPDIKEWL